MCVCVCVCVCVCALDAAPLKTAAVCPLFDPGCHQGDLQKAISERDDWLERNSCAAIYLPNPSATREDSTLGQFLSKADLNSVFFLSLIWLPK